MISCLFCILDVCVCAVMFKSVTPWTVAHQAPLSMGFPRQEYWSGLPFPSLGIFPTLPSADRFFTTSIGKHPDAGKDWGQEEKGNDRGWDGWIASPTQWTWVWVNSRSWWWTGRPGVLRFMGSQRVEHNSSYWATELNWIFFHLLCLSQSALP